MQMKTMSFAYENEIKNTDKLWVNINQPDFSWPPQQSRILDSELNNWKKEIIY